MISAKHFHPIRNASLSPLLGCKKLVVLVPGYLNSYAPSSGKKSSSIIEGQVEYILYGVFNQSA